MGTAPWKQLLLNALESNSTNMHSSFFQLLWVFKQRSDLTPDPLTVPSISEGLKGTVIRFKSSLIAVAARLLISSIAHLLSKERELGLLVLQKQDCSTSVLGANPGLPSLDEKPSQESSLDPSAGPVEAFCLLVLDPEQVDYLSLTRNERLTFAAKLSIDGEKFWTTERVNP